ncbi:MAG: hypothetical protein KFW07_02530 [Mycoplasmataceae bacterium]|nr:hypothetical protein [Mycoplasmataceae bacterium]
MKKEKKAKKEKIIKAPKEKIIKPPKEKIIKAPKPKKSISQKISSINTTSNIDHGNVQVNPKDKRVKWFFGISILAFLSLGIGLPVGLGWEEYKVRKALPNDSLVLGGTDGDQIIVGDILDQNKNKKQIDIDTEKIENIIVEKLYNEERNAFLKFEAFVNNTKYLGTTNKVGATSFGVDVSKSYKDIRSAQESQLNASKKTIRESFPVDWPEKWKNELKTNELYGNSSTEKEAIDYMTKTIAKTAAFARFNSASINISIWKESDLSLRNIQDIKYKDDDGKEQTIFAGTRLFSDDIGVGLDNFLSSGKSNIAIPSKRNPLTPSNEVPISVYENKSYVLSERNPVNRLPKLYKDYFKSTNISSFSIPIMQNTSSTKMPWVITKAVLKQLFTVKRSESGKLIIPFEHLSNFKGANTQSTPEQQLIDKTVLNTMVSSDTGTPDTTKAAQTSGSQLGSSKVASKASLIANENESRAFHIAAISAIDNPTETDGIYKIRKSNPLIIFLNKILKIDQSPTSTVSPLIQDLAKFLNDSLVPKFSIPDSLESEVAFSPAIDFNLYQYNIDLFEKIDLIDDSPFNIVFGNLIKESFYDSNPYGDGLDVVGKEDWKKWTVYELSLPTPNGPTGTYLFANDTGLKIYNIENVVDSSATAMLKRDVQNTIDVADNPDQVVLYDIAAQYNKIANDNIITKILMEENKDYIILKLIEKDSTLNPESSTKIFNSVYENIIGNINNIIDPERTKALEGIFEFIDGLVSSMNSYDFRETKTASSDYDLVFYNGFNYNVGTFQGLNLIYAEFFNKLNKIIEIKAVNNLGGK